MKITRILLAIISVMICTTASARIDVNALTLGGWESSDTRQCYFFNRDGSALAAGYTAVPLKWKSIPDGSVEVTDGGLNTWYITELKGRVMYRRDGAKCYQQPFAEVDDEITRRKGRIYRDKTWSPPCSPAQLAAQLDAKLWIGDEGDRSIYFRQTDTCYVTDLRRLIVNDKYVWHALDSATISLTQANATLGHEPRILKVKMLPDAFEVSENGVEERYIHNAYYDLEYLNTVLDMVYVAPAGCYNFFVRDSKEIDAFLHSVYPGSEKHPDYAVMLNGGLWQCSGIEYSTGGYRKVSYVNHLSKDDNAQRSFDTMAAILGELWTPAPDQSDENTLTYINDSPGGPATIITLTKTRDGVTLVAHTR